MKDHKDKGILQIEYNFLNLPKNVTFNDYISTRGGKIYVNTSYIYRADGVKVGKQHKYKNPVSVSNLISKYTDYLDGFQYEEDLSITSRQLKFIPTSEGYFDFEKNKYIYNYSDHLGNVRLSYFHNGSRIEVLEENNYYPFGLKHEGYNALAGNKSYQYKYNGKELQVETGMYDYEARFYMPDIARWGVVDPLAELQFKHSSYSYVYNNPISFSDPTGMIGDCPGGNCPEGVSDIKTLPNGEKEVQIEEVVLPAPIKPIKSHDASLSWMGINSLNAYHASEDRLAAAIRNSNAALATEKFENNLAFAMGTFIMGGSNIVASAGWVAFDTWADYQDPEDQEGIQAVQAMALVVQIKHGNISGIENLVKNADDIAETIVKLTGFTKHGLNRAIQRGVKTPAILDAIKNPLKIGKVSTDALGRQSQRYIGKSAEVVISPQTGKIISVNPTSSSKAAKLLKQLEQ